MTALNRLREAFVLPLANHLPRLRIADRLRYRLYAAAGFDISGPCTIWGPVTLRPLGSAGNVKIGRRAFINTEIRFGANAEITIGDEVAIGPRVSLETTSHGLVHVQGAGRGTNSAPIHIESRAWLGAGVLVMPGVTIGHDSVIAAGAVVTRDVEPWSVYAGVPAKRIRTIDPVVDATRP